jgi:uncharacterized membrane protein YfcA
MVLGLSAADLLVLVLAILAGGIVVGLLAGLFGIGGGAVIVPVLYEVFGVLGVPEAVRFQLCIGTSLAIMLPTTWWSYVAHRAKGAVLPDVVRTWALPAVAGVAAGAVMAAFAPAALFKLAFVVFATVIAAKLLFGRESWRVADNLPGRLAMSGYGFLVGLTSALTGVSGGSVTTMVLTLYGKPIHNAVATAAGVGIPITVAGTIGYALAGWPRMTLLPPFSLGFVSLIGFVLVAPVSSLAAGHGARLAHWLSKRTLEIAFGLFLLLIALRFVISLAA